MTSTTIHVTIDATNVNEAIERVKESLASLDHALANMTFATALADVPKINSAMDRLMGQVFDTFDAATIEFERIAGRRPNPVEQSNLVSRVRGYK